MTPSATVANFEFPGNESAKAISLLALSASVTRQLSVPQLQNVWITAELSDVSVRGGHCYMELLEKNPSSGQPVAKARAVIWANYYNRIGLEFQKATGQRFSTGLKVMVKGSVSYHPIYGMSIVITAVNPSYTMGDLEQRRREILARLSQEGVLELNRQLDWPLPAMRIAIVSSPTAAGFGDFVNQLFTHPSKLRFNAQLFPAIMQGEQAPASIINALDTIALNADRWDCVVIIRGGGASSDLASFDNYSLAASVAQFPIPIIVGIGHERDVTVLDYVANMRVKTPTAAAEWLINRGLETLNKLQQTGAAILQAVTDRISGCQSQIAYFEGLLPIAPVNLLERAKAHLEKATLTTAGIGSRRITPELSRLDHHLELLQLAGKNAISRSLQQLDSREQLIRALSPEAILLRGYSITRINGRAINSATQVTKGDLIDTTLADGTISSVVT